MALFCSALHLVLVGAERHCPFCQFAHWQFECPDGITRVSPMASFFLLLRQKKETKEKATPDRSTALALNSFSWSEGQGAARVKPGSLSRF